MSDSTPATTPTGPKSEPTSASFSPDSLGPESRAVYDSFVARGLRAEIVAGGGPYRRVPWAAPPPPDGPGEG
jgi:hypothetical protein